MSRPPETTLERSYLTENSSSENRILRPRRKETPDRIPPKRIIIYEVYTLKYTFSYLVYISYGLCERSDKRLRIARFLVTAVNEPSSTDDAVPRKTPTKALHKGQTLGGNAGRMENYTEFLKAQDENHENHQNDENQP